MNKNTFYYLFILSVSLFLLSSCVDNDDPGSGTGTENEKTNQWIYKTMDENYLWYDEIPEKNKLNFNQDPENFFQQLLSDQDGVDKEWIGYHLYFSHIEKKQEVTKAISETEPTYGFEYIAYQVRSTDYYYARVLYVLPDSPAERAGLKRDDWIMGINGKDGNLVDYSVLDGGDAISLNLRKADYEKGGWINKGTLDLPAAEIIPNNPLFLDSVYVYGDRKIGYLVYNHFSAQAEGGNDGAYDSQMKSIFADFKAKGVNEFVLDLRFNGGGLVSSARLLSSLLAPADALGKTFCELIYNDKHKRNSKYDFDKTVSSSNLDLKRLYVLTGQTSASASEAVINCLRPYMGNENVHVIGDETLGKAVGSNPYGEKEAYDWMLHPITFRIVNSEGEADYGQKGFTPETYIYEYGSDPSFIELLPLGNTREILLSTAIQQITGVSARSPQLRKDFLSDDASLLNPVYNSSGRYKPNGLEL